MLTRRPWTRPYVAQRYFTQQGTTLFARTETPQYTTLLDLPSQYAPSHIGTPQAMSSQQRQASYGVLGEVGYPAHGTAARHVPILVQPIRSFAHSCTGRPFAFQFGTDAYHFCTIQTNTNLFYAGGCMKTEIKFDPDKDLITFTLHGENASETALLRVLKIKRPKIEWIEHAPENATTWSYSLVQFSIVLK